MTVLRLLGRLVVWIFHRLFHHGRKRAAISALVLIVAFAFFAKTIKMWLPGVVGLALLIGIIVLVLPKVTKR